MKKTVMKMILWGSIFIAPWFQPLLAQKGVGLYA